MSNKKNQHYVPQFYLRFFTSEGSNQIALFNLKAGKVVADASIKHQCSKNFFYGEDLLAEKTLEIHIETPTSKIFSDIIHGNRLPPLSTNEYTQIIVFILFQHGRTLAAAEDGKAFFRKHVEPGIKRMMLDSREFTPEDLEGISLGIARPANLNLATSSELLPLVLDLKLKLLVNTTAREFITSDHPVVKTNPYLAGSAFGSVAGWAATGIQVFLPLSPRHQLVLYDSKVYRVGTRRSDAVPVNRESDVDGLNTLQLLNAHENVFFQSIRHAGYVTKLFDLCKACRPDEWLSSRLVATTDAAGEVVAGRHTIKFSPVLRTPFSFSLVQKSKKRVAPENRRYVVRQPKLMDEYMEG